MDTINTLLTVAQTYWPAVLAVIGAFSVLANLTPTDTDNKIVNFVGNVVNIIGGYWHNPDDKTVTPTVVK